VTQPASKPRKTWRGSNPTCDFCKMERNILGIGHVFFDAATLQGPWALMCRQHFMLYGLPMGQEYRCEGDQWFKVRNLDGKPDRPTLDDENAEMAAEEARERKS
jgi:hypothetical protein